MLKFLESKVFCGFGKQEKAVLEILEQFYKYFMF